MECLPTVSAFFAFRPDSERWNSEWAVVRAMPRPG